MSVTDGPTTRLKDGHQAPQQIPHILNVLERRYHVRFYESIAAIMALRQTYKQDRYIFVRGDNMASILKGLGARDDDFEHVKQISDLTGPDPTLDYRTVTSGRYCIDVETRSIQRLETQPYVLTLQDDYKRHDSGIPRMFDEAPPDMQGNTVVQALMLVKALVLHGVPVTGRDQLDYSSSRWIMTVFNARTHTDENRGIYGEPALEGVHSDGSDHTMTVFLGSLNMHPDSAVTLIHDKQETTGIPSLETNPLLIRGRVQHRQFLDTLMLKDYDFKHSVTPLYQLNCREPATRDMMVLFTRRPKAEGHASGYVDTMNLHSKAPLHLPLWLP